MTEKAILRLLLAAALLNAQAPQALAQYGLAATQPAGSVPGGINYQGRLSNAGSLVNGIRNVVFRLYDAPTGGTPLWTSPTLPSTVSDGVFGAILDIPVAALATPGQKYLEIEVEGLLFAPRDPLRSVPYAKIATALEGSLDITNGGLFFSVAGSTMVFISSTTGQIGIGTTVPGFPVASSSFTVIGSGAHFDWYIGRPTVTANSPSEDIFIAGNFEIGGTLVSFSAGNRFEQLALSTELVSGRLFGVGAGDLAVTESGKVGMGSPQPTITLEVVAVIADVPALSLDHPTAPQIHLRSLGPTTLRLRAEHDGTDGTFGTAAGGGELRILAGGGAEKIRIETGGDFGIGIAPTVPLDVNGSANISGVLTLGTALAVAEGGTAGTTPLSARSGLSALARDGSDVAGGFPTFAVKISSFASEFGRLSFNPNNCVLADDFARGVDQFGQAECLDVLAFLDLTETANELRIYDVVSSTTNDLALLGSAWRVSASGVYDIIFDSPTFVIDSSLNRIGIGEASPSTKLDVNGTVNATAFTESGGTTLVNSITNTAGTMGRLVNNGGNCAANESISGIDAAGAQDGCVVVTLQGSLDTHTANNSTHNATAANTADRIVLRDGTGNFLAGTISAALNGNANTADAFFAAAGQCAGANRMTGIQSDGDANCLADDDQPDCDAEVPDDITIDQSASGTFRLDQTIGSTTEGQMAWDATNNQIEVGNGAGGVMTFNPDTSANTECAGTTTYLDGDGGCDDITNVYVNESGDGMSGTLSFSGVGVDINASAGDLSFDAGANQICLGLASCGPEDVVFDAELRVTTLRILDSGGAGGEVPHNCIRRTSNVNAASITLSCSAGEQAMGGGMLCGSGTDSVEISRPTDNPPTTWQGQCTAADAGNTVYAVCCAY